MGGIQRLGGGSRRRTHFHVEGPRGPPVIAFPFEYRIILTGISERKKKREAEKENSPWLETGLKELPSSRGRAATLGSRAAGREG